MKTILGILLITIAIVLGVYVGVFLMFIGGIAQIVHGVSATPADGVSIGWGLVRVLCASWAGVWSAFIVGGAGVALIASDN